MGIEERKDYILTNLSKASDTLRKANELTTKYEQELEDVRKQAQLEITKSQKIHKEILEVEVNISQKYIDSLLDNITKDLLNKKEIALNNLDKKSKTWKILIKFLHYLPMKALV